MLRHPGRLTPSQLERGPTVRVRQRAQLVSLRVQKVICCPKRHPKMLFCTVYKRMMGLEPTTFCMANAGGRSRPCARVRRKPAVCGHFDERERTANERERTPSAAIVIVATWSGCRQAPRSRPAQLASRRTGVPARRRGAPAPRKCNSVTARTRSKSPGPNGSEQRLRQRRSHADHCRIRNTCGSRVCAAPARRPRGRLRHCNSDRVRARRRRVGVVQRGAVRVRREAVRSSARSRSGFRS
jgi:hypothetical protein